MNCIIINFENLKYTDKYTDKWKKFEFSYAYRQFDSLFLDSGIFVFRIVLLANNNIWVGMWVAAPLIGGLGTVILTTGGRFYLQDIHSREPPE